VVREAAQAGSGNLDLTGVDPRAYLESETDRGLAQVAGASQCESGGVETGEHAVARGVHELRCVAMVSAAEAKNRASSSRHAVSPMAANRTVEATRSVISNVVSTRSPNAAAEPTQVRDAETRQRCTRDIQGRPESLPVAGCVQSNPASVRNARVEPPTSE
jgi:hypothetical protein